MLLAHYNSITAPHMGQGGSERNPSPRIWSNMIGQAGNPDGSGGWYGWFDDFEGYNYLAASGAFGKAPYYGFIENSATIKPITTKLGGVVELTTGAAADNDCSFGMGGGATAGAGLVKVGVGTPGTLTSNGKKLLFEARVLFPQVSNDFSAFVGLTEEARCQDNGFFTDAPAVAAVDLLGFWVLAADGDSLNFGYNVASGTAQTTISGIQALTASTWYKIGFVYDPSKESAYRIKAYVDGVEQGTYVTGTNVSASTFPGGEELAPMIDVKTNTTAARKIQIDWWGVAQES